MIKIFFEETGKYFLIIKILSINILIKKILIELSRLFKSLYVQLVLTWKRLFH